MRISDWSSDVCSSDLIIGDANLCEVSTYLKIGTTALVLSMIEAGYLTRPLTVEGSVAALRAVSHDPTCKELITLHDGRTLTGVQLQMEYLDLARKFVDERLGYAADAHTDDVVHQWGGLLTRHDSAPTWGAHALNMV